MRIPLSTYRLQVNADFNLAAVKTIIPYLEELGISDLYLSPLCEARPGSQHGYDVIRPDRVNPELGSLDQFNKVAETARDHGMGVLLDIVPNHMAASEANPWWRDVLENGRASPYAAYFDVDWQADPPGTGRVLLPVLGQPLDAAIADGEVTVGVRDHLPVIRYYDRDFPLDPATYGTFFDLVGIHDRDLRQSVDDVPDRENAHRRQERAVRAEIARNATREWFRRHGDQEIALAPDRIRQLHDAQPYSLWFWLRGTRRINYRRFFDISDLAALRVEDPQVFEAVHALALHLVREDRLTGLRIDHIDGLRDPEAYIRNLRERARDTYVIAEKILIGAEELPSAWTVDGTTGYDFTGALNAVFIDPRGYDRLRAWYETEVGSPPFEQLLIETKQLVIDLLFDSEIRDLAAAFVDLAARMGITLQKSDAQAAIALLTAALPVYRTYITERGVPDESRRVLLAARSKIGAEPESLRLLLRMLQLEVPQEHFPAVVDFVMQWQQFTGPVMAKGLEDTAFYQYNALISVCEVGSLPPDLPGSIDAFLGFLERRQHTWPRTLNATSTHDTKRSEDVRARINVLSELADDWIRFVNECGRRFNRFTTLVGDRAAPDTNEQLLLLQTIIGAWPLNDRVDDAFRERVREFMLKALREAKLHTSWSNIDEPYEQAVLAFCDALLQSDEFERLSRQLRQRVAFWGALSALSQLVLKLGAPGVPDFYQGTETWNLALVDPDNRRPVDYDLRWRLLHDGRSVREKLESWQDGAVKVAITRAGLELRNRMPSLFRFGACRRLAVTGPRRDHIIAFAREYREQAAVFVAARWFSRLCRGNAPPDRMVWDDTALDLPPRSGAWRNVLTGEMFRAPAGDSTSAPARVPAADLLDQLPCAMLVLER